VPWTHPSHDLQERAAERVDVRLLDQFVGEHLRRQVDRGADRGVGQRKCFVNLFRYALICQMRLEFFINDDVRGFQITVHNVQRMQVFDRM